MSGGPPGGVEVTVPDAEAMQDLGRRMAGLLRAGDLVLLDGPLGAGKTTLVQGLATGVGVRGPVTSPTFVIARVHPSLGTGPQLVHVDAYRVGSGLELDDLDLDADLEDAVVVVEWGTGSARRLADDRLEITIERPAVAAAGEPAGGEGPDEGDASGDGADGGGVRRVTVRGVGDRWSGADLAVLRA